MPLDKTYIDLAENKIQAHCMKYKHLLSLQKFIITFCEIENGKIIFSEKTIFKRLNHTVDKCYDHVNETAGAIPNLFDKYKQKQDGVTHPTIQTMLPMVARTPNKVNMPLSQILQQLKIDNLFPFAMSLGLFLFYDGNGSFNQAVWSELKGGAEGEYIWLTDFIFFIKNAMGCSAPANAYKFFETPDVLKLANTWHNIFDFLSGNKLVFDKLLRIRIDTLKLFLTDALLCIDVVNHSKKTKMKCVVQ